MHACRSRNLHGDEREYLQYAVMCDQLWSLIITGSLFYKKEGSSSQGSGVSAAAQARSATAAALQNSPSPSPAPSREKRRREGQGRREEEGEKDGKKVSQTMLIDSIQCLCVCR